MVYEIIPLENKLLLIWPSTLPPKPAIQLPKKHGTFLGFPGPKWMVKNNGSKPYEQIG